MLIYIYRQKKLIVLFLLLYGLTLACKMKLEIWKGRLLDCALGLTSNSLSKSMLLVFAAFTTASLLQYAYSLTRNLLLTNADRLLRKNYFDALLNKTIRTYISIPEGRISADYTDKLDIVYQKYFITGAMLGENVILTLTVLITLAYRHYSLAVIALFAMPIPMLVPRLLKKRLVDTSKAQMEAVNTHLTAFRTWLKGIDIIKVFSCEQYILSRYDVVNELMRKKEMEAETVKSIETGISFLVTIIVQIVMLIYGAYLIYADIISAGQYYAVIGLIGLLKSPMFWSASFLEDIFSSQPARQSLAEFIKEENIHERVVKHGFPADTNIEASQIYFSYTEEKPILCGIDFSIMKNERVFFSGVSGSGKSTIMHLIAGIYKPDAGVLTIGGIAPENICCISDLIAIQPQEAYLFQASLLDNLLLGKEEDEKKVKEVLCSVGLEKYTASPYFKDTIISGQSGFSGGEKKRIGIARTILRKCPIMIFDEPFANIDAENISKVKQAIFSITGSTVLIISHLIDEECQKEADSVYTLKDGMLKKWSNV